MAKTYFCTPPLNDGRDLLIHLLPKGETEWRPSLNLYELIMQIPGLIQDAINLEKAKKFIELRSIGKFHLGLKYDMTIWLNNTQCRVFPCQQENEVNVKVKDKQGTVTKQVRKNMIDIYIVITEYHLIMLKTDTKIKNVAKLIAWASL